MIPVILSGGSGSRLWPLSRQQRPKQFLPVVDELTLFQSTLERVVGLAGVQAPIVVCNEDHRFMVAEQMRTLGLDNQGIILEPVGKNTAPAIALAALSLVEYDKDAVMLVLPADHIIRDVTAYHQAIAIAEKAAKEGDLVTFGIVPTHAETGYGYIQAEAGLPIMAVKAFVEKPDAQTAKAYLQQGGYLWNSGMFMFRVDRYLEELKKYQTDVYSACELAMQNIEPDGDFIRIEATTFSASPSISIDYAVMEKTNNAVVVPLDAGWNDVGAWSAVWEVGAQDENLNVSRGDNLFIQANRNLVYSEDRLVALVGVDNLVVVDTKDATLVAHKDRVQDVKQVVAHLKADNRPEAVIHREVNRPWGAYDCIDCGDRFQVKRITVQPGASLSLQKHQYRAEHWIVVKGTAEVTCDEKTFLLQENESTYIPVGSKHRLANPGEGLLEIIEVQSGSYLGEDDIERFDDDYGRAG